jgi:DnaJ-class molecular chaperone
MGNILFKGTDVYSLLHIPVTLALLGGVVQLDTLYGEVETKLPSSLQPDKMFKLDGYGLPYTDLKATKGDHYFKIKYVMPENLNKNQISMWQEFSKLDN